MSGQRATVAEVQAALSAADFPADKDALLECAVAAQAGDAVLAALRSLPPVDYRNVAEVVRSVTRPLGPQPDAREHALKQRADHGRSGVAEAELPDVPPDPIAEADAEISARRPDQ